MEQQIFPSTLNLFTVRSIYTVLRLQCVKRNPIRNDFCVRVVVQVYWVLLYEVTVLYETVLCETVLYEESRDLFTVFLRGLYHNRIKRIILIPRLM